MKLSKLSNLLGISSIEIPDGLASQTANVLVRELHTDLDRVLIQEQDQVLNFYYDKNQIDVEDLIQDHPTLLVLDKFLNVLDGYWTVATTSNSIIRPTEGEINTRVILNLNSSSAYIMYALTSSVIDRNLGSAAAATTITSHRFGLNRSNGQIEIMSEDQFTIDGGTENDGEVWRLGFMPKFVPTSGYSRISADLGSTIVVPPYSSQPFSHGKITRNSYMVLPDVAYNCPPDINYSLEITMTAAGGTELLPMSITIGGIGTFIFEGGTPADFTTFIGASGLTGILAFTAVGAVVAVSVITTEEIFSVTGDGLTLTHVGLDDVLASRTFVPSGYADFGMDPLPQRIINFNDTSQNHRFTVQAVPAGTEVGQEFVKFMTNLMQTEGVPRRKITPGLL